MKGLNIDRVTRLHINKHKITDIQKRKKYVYYFAIVC